MQILVKNKDTHRGECQCIYAIFRQNLVFHNIRFNVVRDFLWRLRLTEQRLRRLDNVLCCFNVILFRFQDEHSGDIVYSVDKCCLFEVIFDCVFDLVEIDSLRRLLFNQSIQLFVRVAIPVRQSAERWHNTVKTAKLKILFGRLNKLVKVMHVGLRSIKALKQKNI